MKNFNDMVARIANWINEQVVGSVITFIICVLFVVGIYIALMFQGYNKWNTSTGLFSNTLESSFELITGVGAVVAVVALHKKHDKHTKSLNELHDKIDKLGKKK